MVDQRCLTVGWSGCSQASPTRKVERSLLLTPRLHYTIAVATGSQLQVFRPCISCAHALAIACTFSSQSGIDQTLRLERGTPRSLVVRDAGSWHFGGWTVDDVNTRPCYFRLSLYEVSKTGRRKWCDNVTELTAVFDRGFTSGHHPVWLSNRTSQVDPGSS
jgi:hypothetical protein